MVSEKHRKLRRRRRRRRERKEEPVRAEKREFRGLDKFYHDNYKSLFLITIVMLVLSLGVIGYTYLQTGDIIYKGVSLSGGLTVTLPTAGQVINPSTVENSLISQFPESDFIVREISELGEQRAIVIEASASGQDSESLSVLEGDILAFLEQQFGGTEDASTEIVGPSLGQSFFQQTAKAVLIAFVLMGWVVFMYFGQTAKQKIAVAGLTFLEAILIWYANNIIVSGIAILIGILLAVIYIRFSIPSAAVILAAISTIVFTVAVVDVLQMRISTAGIAAFLMLIGYSVDTDILLSTRVLKRSSGTVYERIKSTVKTGLTMECSTASAALVTIIFTQSDVIREIMTIVFIGLLADIAFTWIQNTGILRMHLEKKGGSE